tara:strand:- start:46177 stop:46914 length:738 start_codon:yes stop_codon:yes gene_type:complete
MTQEILETLRDDEQYYGEFGKQFLSNSDIKKLLENPAMFGVSTPPTLDMLKGSYMHHAVLEPEKLASYVTIDSTTRYTKKYKEAVADMGVDILLLTPEREELDVMAHKIKENFRFSSEIYADGNEFEVPAVKKIFNHMWKGKADVVCADKLIDLKTTSRLSEFKYSANRYNYDSQAYLYNQFFGKPLEFYVIEKGSHRLEVFTCSEAFLERGREKVIHALEVYKKFFGENPTDDISQYVAESVLY